MSQILKTLIIGLDGAELEYMRGLACAGELPHLDKLMSQGVATKLRSTPAFTSAAAWSAIITGRNPGKNRVFDWMNKRPGGGFVESIVSSSHRESPAFWHEIRELLRTAVIHVPCTYPPEPLNGIMISGQGHPPKQDARISYPDSLLNELPAEHTPYISEYTELEKLRRMGLSVEDALALFFKAEDRRTALSIHLCGKHNTDVCMIVYTSTDQFGHCGDTQGEAKKRAYRNCDKNIGLLLDNLTDSDTNVIIISDHGNVPIRRRLNFWKLFHDNGLIRRPLGVDLYTVVPHSVCGSLIIKVRGRDRRGIVKPAEYEQVRDYVTAVLLETRDDSGEPLFSAVRTREELYHGPYIEEAPDLNYELADEHTQIVFTPTDKRANCIEFYSPEKSLSDSIFNRIDTGVHSRYGVFIARGPHINKNSDAAKPLTVYDVAPFVLYSLGLPVPDDMDGRVPQELFEPEHIKSNPISQKANDTGSIKPANEASAPAYTEEEEEMIKRRLEDLGYL